MANQFYSEEAREAKTDKERKREGEEGEVARRDSSLEQNNDLFRSDSRIQ